MTTPIALVTGASRGLGRSAALALAQRGTDIVLTYRGKAAEAAAVVNAIEARGRRAASLPLDLADAASIDTFTITLRQLLQDQFAGRRIRYLLNNAGIGVNAPIVATTVAQLDQMVNIHFKGPFLLTQALLPMLEDGGRILNVSSGLTRFTMPGYAAYAAMKGAIEVFTRYLASELGPRGISVNAIAPGAIETDFGGGRVRDDAQVNHHIASATAKGRVGLPDDIGPAMAMLLTGDMHWITGQRIEASGGMLL